LAHELIPLGIRVNGIAPGYFPTMVCKFFDLLYTIDRNK
jgi:NAD(P)-dependent dehydrogenase (short-subunit alcohol dehydrogenase family)